MSTSNPTHRLHRLDRFTVPEAARSEFLARVHETHAVLRTQPGFVGDLLLERAAGPGRFNIVTLVTWEDSAAIEQVRAVMEAKRKETGFDPSELMARLGIDADMAVYADIPEIAVGAL